ncbi:MAG: hypothetical protein ACXW18_05605 [Pyrinomonadaceae bacterium]
MRHLAILGLLLALPATAAYSQDPASSSTTRREDPLQRRLTGGVQLELIEAAMMNRPATPAPNRSAVLDQIRKDFQRIQFANDDLINTLSGKTAYDSRVITRAASEIKTRAKRLKQNLGLPVAPKGSELSSATNEENIRSSIARLTRLVDSFVSNPMLSQRHV